MAGAARLVLVVFCPFAAGYFLSFFFRNVNAVAGRDLARDFALSPAELGLLTSTYLLAFAAFQLPLGVLLDRFGPRRVVGALYALAAAGAALFALAQDFATLCAGRALIGLGVSGGLMGAIKAFTLWFPLSRLATLNGFYLAIGGLGGLAATAPAEAFLGAFGWRALFAGVAALSLVAAAAILFVVPERPLPGARESVVRQFAGFARVFRSGVFWRLALPLVVGHGAYQALAGLWLGPWLQDVAGLARADAARTLLYGAAAYMAGSVFFGVASDQLARFGVSRLAVYRIGQSVALAAFACFALGIGVGLTAIVFVYGFAAISASLAYALLTARFPSEMAGRVNTASNVLMFLASFAFQWGVGAVLRLFPAGADRYEPAGYALAFALLALAQLAALAGLFGLRESKSG